MFQYDGNANLCGKNILKLRKELKLTQDDLAVRMQSRYNVQIDQRAISRVEKGKRCIADYELLAFSKALGVSLESLFDKEEPM